MAYALHAQECVNVLAAHPKHAFLAPLFEVERFSVLERWPDEGDSDLISAAVEEFLLGAETALERLAAALSRLDYEEAIPLAHHLKSVFATFGMTRAHALAREIAQRSEERRSNDLGSLNGLMRGCFLAGRRALLAHLADHGVSA